MVFIMKQATIIGAFSLLFILGFASIGHSQEMDRDKLKSLIESRNFIFKAQSVSPQGMASRQLTSEYDVKLFSDTVITYLPYFGRAYTPPAPGEEGGFRFTSTSFQYKVKEKKKGGWDIHIQPADTKDVRQLFLSITESGYASLQVMSNNRQPISFYGYIAAR